jgi:hypothetical protein
VFTPTPLGLSDFPEGVLTVSFAGAAAYGIFDFESDFGQYMIDNFEVTFAPPGIPEPWSPLLLGFGLIAAAFVRRNL